MDQFFIGSTYDVVNEAVRQVRSTYSPARGTSFSARHAELERRIIVVCLEHGWTYKQYSIEFMDRVAAKMNAQYIEG